jgi:hypothetical protein
MTGMAGGAPQLLLSWCCISIALASSGGGTPLPCQLQLPAVDLSPRLLLAPGRLPRSCRLPPPRCVACAIMQGAAEKKTKKNSQCTYVLYLAKIELFCTYDAVVFFIAFFEFPLSKNAQKRTKKNR